MTIETNKLDAPKYSSVLINHVVEMSFPSFLA